MNGVIMKCLTFLVLCLSTTFASSIHASSGLSTTPLVTAHKNCFHGVFTSYDSWFDFLHTSRQKKFERQGVGDVSNKLAAFERNFKSMFPVAEYELAQSSLSCNLITYEVNGEAVNGVLVMPKTNEEKRPVIIYNRGGTRGFGSLVFGHIAHELFPLALEGFAIIASEYRKDEQYGSDNIDEVTALFDIIDSLEMLDAEKIGVYGNSRGGMTSWQLSKVRPERISAMATTSGVTNSRLWASNRAGIKNNIMTIDRFSQDEDRIYDLLSPVKWVAQTSSAPVLIIHSRDDDKVSVEHSLQMVQELVKQNRVFSLKIYADGGHSLIGHKDDSLKEISAWFSHYLK
ncbi:alpha/beta hydrolase family protein [Alteromonas oceanisediminis]|uniref:alpha/beta hydrolase family protein n=1 Tax=Alteromonas oceanisediminis TaxID=2836180 RepID=UPI001BD96E2A|nr:prolyl oligopeptidase family serine peptidase [Alteromonas oceanisediminis]MBT0585118.1 prolyl oligopeptidase family serine peptidase [Alteromonas oceanisediminis]